MKSVAGTDVSHDAAIVKFQDEKTKSLLFGMTKEQNPHTVFITKERSRL
jgi:hypothetical protein